MSLAEAERFAKDLAGDAQLRDTVKAGAGGLASVVGVANKHGYSFTIDEAKQYMQSQSGQQMTDAQLDAVAGGKAATATSSSAAATTVTAGLVVVVTTGPTAQVSQAVVTGPTVQIAQAVVEVAATASVN